MRFLLLLFASITISAQDGGYIHYEFNLPTNTGSETIKAMLSFNNTSSLFTWYKIGYDANGDRKGFSVSDNKQLAMKVSLYDEKGMQV